MNFDLRLPLGLMFTLFGAMLSIYGLTSDKAMYENLPGAKDFLFGVNVNLGWGLVMLAFGVIMLVFALRSRGQNGNDPKA